MATKATPKKKTTSKKTVAKRTTAKAGSKSVSSLPIGVLYEKCPEDHQATGKYRFFYFMFALTTIIFAALAVWLYVFSSEILNKYQEIEACARTRGATCEIHTVDNGDEEVVSE